MAETTNKLKKGFADISRDIYSQAAANWRSYVRGMYACALESERKRGHINAISSDILIYMTAKTKRTIHNLIKYDIYN